MNKNYLFLLFLVLVISGLGCDKKSPVSLDKYQDNSNQHVRLKFQDKIASNATDQQKSSAMSSNTATTTANNNSTSTNNNFKLNNENKKNMSNEKLAFPGILPDKEVENKQILIKTNKGDIVFELLPKEGPKAASNFVYLVQHKFYDGLIFHRVVPGFVIQGGDPTGTGTGGPGYKFEDDKVNLEYKEGIVAMANAGPDTNGSQFFIMLADNPLPPNYSIFGRVTKGMEVVKQIVQGDKMTSIVIEDLEK